MTLFQYGKEEIEYLSNADPKIGALIKQHGFVAREIETDPYKALIDSIVAQQISGKAAVTVFNRLCATVGELTPQSVLKTEVQALRGCGLSGRKVSYIRSASEFFAENEASMKNIQSMDDNEVLSLLTQIKGVGVWTAEMLLIFSLGRKNILSYNDLGIRKGLMSVHKLSGLDKTQLDSYKDLYSPYCSIASFYLWIAAQN